MRKNGQIKPTTKAKKATLYAVAFRCVLMALDQRLEMDVDRAFPLYVYIKERPHKKILQSKVKVYLRKLLNV